VEALVGNIALWSPFMPCLVGLVEVVENLPCQDYSLVCPYLPHIVIDPVAHLSLSLTYTPV